MRGMRWRIGDGSAVKIFHDRWLPGSVSGRVMSPISDSNSEAYVSTLIDHELFSWREAEVDRMFLPMEALVIKAIPLSFSNRCDTIFWPRNHDGVYSVKSGYKLIMEMECGNSAGTSSSSMATMKSIWNGIWKVDVPNRIRLLLWRAGNDSLPTRVNLARRKLLTETTCSLCKLEPEDTLHALWKCPLLSTVWQVSFANLVAGANDVPNFLDVIRLAQQDRSRFAMFAWTTSLIWLRRNKLRAEEETFPLAKIVSLASDGLHEYQQLRPIHMKLPRTARSVRWRPPPTGLFKVNFDGASFAEDNKAGLGIIIRNDVGLVMAAMTQ